MKVGTKSLLFGVHQFLWHPLTVIRAWHRLYGHWPDKWALIAIFCHDLGYWGAPNMDGKEGKQHPLVGAKICTWITYRLARLLRYRKEVARAIACQNGLRVLAHSRDTAKQHNLPTSDLCWADKFCVVYEPAWFYLLRARLSGELFEYRINAMDEIPDSFSYRDWFGWFRKYTYLRPQIQHILKWRRSGVMGHRGSVLFPWV